MNQLYNGAGTYSYSNLTNFAKDFSGNTTGAKSYSTFSQEFGNPIQDLRTSDVNVYAQDMWRLTRHLILNYGLRYEKTFLPQPTMTDPNYPQTGRINSPDADFAPARTLLFVERPDRPAGRLRHLLRAVPWRRTGHAVPGQWPVSDQHLGQPHADGRPGLPEHRSQCAERPGGHGAGDLCRGQLLQPYTQQGTLAVERELARDLSLTASYVWSRGIGLWTSKDLNVVPPPLPEPTRSWTPPATRRGRTPRRSTQRRSIPATATSTRWRTEANPGTTAWPFNCASACRTD